LVDGNIISAGWTDIYVDFSHYNTISYNTIVNQIEQLECGAITLAWGHNNIVKGNTLAENEIGIRVNRGQYNSSIYHNNFINNTQQAGCEPGSNVAFDMGYPVGGNYWSDYTEEDLNGDGIGDTAYTIDSNSEDNYPLMNPWIRPPPLAGDLNSNEIIDLADLVILAKAYLSKPGDSNWNSHADLAAPFNEISLTDVVTLAYRYGQRAS
jgi:parallel beta-helix repeat protein